LGPPLPSVRFPIMDACVSRSWVPVARLASMPPGSITSIQPNPASRTSATASFATGVLTNSEGARNAAVWGKRARWIDAAGIVDGHPVGIAMFDHPDNHAHPTWWHARAYGLLTANPFGVHDFEKRPPGTGTLSVPATATLQLRYRVLLHGAGWDHARIDAAYGAWVGNDHGQPTDSLRPGGTGASLR
jgi:hypothetical protein